MAIWIYFDYDHYISKDGIATSTKALHVFFRYVDEKWGKGYVVGAWVAVGALAALFAIRAYIRDENAKRRTTPTIKEEPIIKENVHKTEPPVSSKCDE